MSEIRLNHISVSGTIIIILFITPHIFLSIFPDSFNLYYRIFIYLFASIFFFTKANQINSKYKNEILFTLCFLIFGTLNLLLKNSTSYFNIISPLFGLYGYIYIRNHEINLNLIKYIIVCFYVYFYIVYYSVIPDYFFRPNFDEDAIVFDNSSSNAISMTLDMLLFFYLILNKYYKADHLSTIFYFSLINLGLVFIQQSRAALIVAVILFFISFFEYNKKACVRFLTLTIISLLFVVFNYYEEILNFYEIFFSEYNITNVIEDPRTRARNYFFSNLDFNNFFVGYPNNTIFATHIDSEILYTYNVFLDVWNRYGFVVFIFFISVMINRLIYHRKYYFPLYYFMPFVFYSLVESIFFPNYWDCFIYLLIFTPIHKCKLHATESSKFN